MTFACCVFVISSAYESGVELFGAVKISRCVAWLMDAARFFWLQISLDDIAIDSSEPEVRQLH